MARQWMAVRDWEPTHSKPVWVSDGKKVGSAVWVGQTNAWAPWNHITFDTNCVTHWKEKEPEPSLPTCLDQKCLDLNFTED